MGGTDREWEILRAAQKGGKFRKIPRRIARSRHDLGHEVTPERGEVGMKGEFQVR